MVFGVPALYRMMLENDRLDQYDLSSLKYCYSVEMRFHGGLQEMERLFGLNIYQVYGSTEAGHVTYSRLNKDPELMSIGLPLKSRTCKVVDPESLESVPTGEIGELV